MSFNTISVVGLGYIGLPTAAFFASFKKKVIGVDVDESIVATINSGKIHILEPGLDSLVRSVVANGYLKASLHPEPADVFLIAVPTPFKAAHEPDISFIESAVSSVAPVLERGNLIVLESTSPVGTTEKLSRWLANARPDLSFPHDKGEESDIRIAHCPERVLPGQVLNELINNDRIIGGMTPACSRAALDLYNNFVSGECVVTDVRTAEMCKLVENSFRDVNIAFANELSMICEGLGINVWDLIRLANRHPRVNILNPGAGVGGHCIAVDPWFIVSQSPERSQLISKARSVNDSKPEWILDQVDRLVNKVSEEQGRNIRDISISCFGLSFKPNIDDLRESPALLIAKRLSHKYSNQVVCVEPHMSMDSRHLHGSNIVLCDYCEAKKSDVLVFLVAHEFFKRDLPSIKDGQRFLDACGLGL